ncbi:MAG: hypothetical protein ABSF51_14560 [Verrucomicrobiota bacterium]|jgi:hypothetical protein
MNNLYPDLPHEWIISASSPEEIRNQPVWIMLNDGRKKQEHFEIEVINGQGAMLVRIECNSRTLPGTVSFVSHRVTQKELDTWRADREAVLKV